MIGDRIAINVDLDVPLPRMVPVEVELDGTRTDDVHAETVRELVKIRERIRPGMTIAVGCGSRSIASLATLVKTVVGELVALGARPFVFPAMGSHGAATADGQRAVLEGYGVIERHVGCPIRATMDVRELGRMPDGTPIYIDRHAASADGIVLINRVKPHTSFHADHESGIVKMMTLGMGKTAGAAAMHQRGSDAFGQLLPTAARFVMDRVPFLFGVAVVENAAQETAILEVIPAEQLFDRERELLARARTMMGRLMFDAIDVLVIDEMGKNISGLGFDPNVTGRVHRGASLGPHVQRIVVLDLTAESHGNAAGVGLADVITTKLWTKLDVTATYSNVITTSDLERAAIPVVMNTAEQAIRLALTSLLGVAPGEARIVRIKNTLELTHILVSEPMLDEVRRHPRMKIGGTVSI